MFSDFNEEAVFTMSLRGRFKLLAHGFEFFQSKRKSGITYWRCAECNRLKCRGKAQSRQIGPKNMVKLYGEHNHSQQSSTIIETPKINQ